MFSHPADYTPVCTTELARVVALGPEFKKRGVKLIALSCDGVESHKGWGKVRALVMLIVMIVFILGQRKMAYELRTCKFEIMQNTKSA